MPAEKDSVKKVKKKRYTREQMSKKIKARLLNDHGSIRRAGKNIGVSDKHLWAVFSLKTKPTERLMNYMNGNRHSDEYYTLNT